MYKYHFHIPNYSSRSNGIILLWEAAYNFSKIREVTVSSFGYGESFEYLPKKYESLIGDYIKNRSDCIVIYPEAVSDNPLQSKMVSRYLMAKPYILNGAGINYGKNDFVFSYSNVINSDLDQYNLLDPSLLDLTKYNYKKRKGKITLYYGKCRLKANFKNISKILKNSDEIFVITRKFPLSKEELYRNIAESELLISLDPLTNILYEATILGTPVLTLDDIFDNEYKNYNYKLFGFKSELEDLNLESVEVEDLREKVIDELSKQLSASKLKTSEIISKIESHFSSKGEKLDFCNKDLAQKDKDYFENIWLTSPIYNCSNAKSIVIFHLMRKNIYIFFMLKIIYRMVNDLLSCPKKIAISILKRYLNHSEISILKNLSNNQKAKINLMVDANDAYPDSLTGTRVEKNIMNKFLLRYLWGRYVL